MEKMLEPTVVRQEGNRSTATASTTRISIWNMKRVPSRWPTEGRTQTRPSFSSAPTKRLPAGLLTATTHATLSKHFPKNAKNSNKTRILALFWLDLVPQLAKITNLQKEIIFWNLPNGRIKCWLGYLRTIRIHFEAILSYCPANF